MKLCWHFSACPTGERMCDSEDCVSTELWCDGWDNCKDGTDEMNCSKFLPRVPHASCLTYNLLQKVFCALYH